VELGRNLSSVQPAITEIPKIMLIKIQYTIVRIITSYLSKQQLANKDKYVYKKYEIYGERNAKCKAIFFKFT